MSSRLLTSLRWEWGGRGGFSAEGAVAEVSLGPMTKVMRECLGESDSSRPRSASADSFEDYVHEEALLSVGNSAKGFCKTRCFDSYCHINFRDFSVLPVQGRKTGKYINNVREVVSQ